MLIDLDFEVVYYFWTRPFLVEDKPCPDEEGEAYRNAVGEWLLERGCQSVLASACGPKGFLTRLYEYLYTQDRRSSEEIIPIGATAVVLMIYEPKTAYLRLVSGTGGCKGEDCASLTPFYERVQSASVIDSFSYDERGRPLFDLIHERMLPYDKRLDDPEVPDDFREWFEDALEECDFQDGRRAEGNVYVTGGGWRGVSSGDDHATIKYSQ